MNNTMTFQSSLNVFVKKSWHELDKISIISNTLNLEGLKVNFISRDNDLGMLDDWLKQVLDGCYQDRAQI